MSNAPLIDIRPDHLQIVQDILKKHVPDHEVWAFGSRVKWTAKEYSDLDLCVISDQSLGLDLKGDLRDDFSESDLPWKVDVVDWATTSESFRKIIEREKVVVQKNNRILSNRIDCGQHVMTLVELAEINPKRYIQRGVIVPFVEMAALPINSRDIQKERVIEKKFTGSGARFANGDTLLARITPCLENGKTALVTCLPLEKNGFGSTEFIVLSARHKEDKNFLYYLVRNDDFRNYAISRMEGTSGRQRVPNEAVSLYQFCGLSANERREIGYALSLLDDRITLLRETNATLEAIAQALFKSWFVDFDPVHAKQQGLVPEGMDEATAALFPDSFEESELGLIPKGWILRDIDKICELGRGSSPRPIQKYMGFGVPWIKIADATASDGMFIFHTKEMILKEGVKNSVRVQPGDLIMSNSASCGITVFVELNGCIHDGWLYFKKYRHIDKNYLFFWLRKIANHLVNIADGSVQKNLNIALVSSQKILCPSHELILVFESITGTLLNKIRDNLKQAQTLTTLRDTLLPRLISGQLRLPETEEAS